MNESAWRRRAAKSVAAEDAIDLAASVAHPLATALPTAPLAPLAIVAIILAHSFPPSLSRSLARARV